MNEFLQVLNEFVDWCYENEEFQMGKDLEEMENGK